MSEIYAWGDGRVLKLFHERVDCEQVERYFKTACAVHAAGLPVPVAYAIAEHNDRHGIVFERIEGVSMLQWGQARPWMIFSGARQLAELHFQMHRCTAPPELPTQKQKFRDRLDALTNVSPAEKDATRLNLEKLPDGDALCHGDFHPDNIIFTQRGPVIIDWDSASRGHPLGDVACTSRLFEVANLPPWSPRYMHWIMKFSRQALHRTYLKRYRQLSDCALEEISAWKSSLSVIVRAPDWSKSAKAALRSN